MGRVTIDDVWVPEVYASYGDVNSIEATAFMQSGIMTANALFDELADTGRTVEMPFWNDLDHSVEPNYSNDNPSDLADIEGIDMGEMYARVAFLNNGWGSADLVTELTGTEPLRKIKEKTGRYWQYQLQHRLVAMASGLYNANLAQNGGDMIVDLSAAAGSTPTAANKWSLEGFIDSIMQKGDRAQMPAAIICHSVIYGTMLKDDIIETREPSSGRLLFATYKESTKIVIDDGVPTIGTGVGRQYVTFLFDAGVIGFGRGTPKHPTSVSRVEEAGNGGGIETIWERRTWMLHPFGYTWTNKQVTGPGKSPTWRDLRHAPNWARILDRRMIGLSFIVTNG